MKIRDGNYREIYKKHFGIDFGSEYAIHHIDGNRTNNNIDNLILLPLELHSKYHQQKQIVDEQKFPTRICGNEVNMQNYSLSYFEDFIETLKECNKWYDFKMFLCGKIPNIHGIKINSGHIMGE